MTNDTNWFMYALFGTFLAWVFFFPTRYDSFKTITDYTIKCAGKYDSQTKICTGAWKSYDVRHYAASRQLQMVIESNNWAIIKRQNCTVYNANNWDCTDAKVTSAITTCFDGKCIESLDSDDIRHVSKWHYYLQAVHDWFNKPSS